MNNEVENCGGSRETPTNKEPKEGWRNVFERVARSIGNTNKNEWLKDMRGNLILVSTVIATMTFQMALNPPGGVRPIKDEYDDGHDEGRKVIPCTIGGKDLKLCPGEAVLAITHPNEYILFLFSNTICLIASLCICLLLVSGMPMHLRFPIWLLSIGMGVTLSSLALSYITAVKMTAPEPIFDTASKFLQNLVITWIGLLVIISLWHTLLLVLWGVKLFRKRNKKAITQKISGEIPVC